MPLGAGGSLWGVAAAETAEAAASRGVAAGRAEGSSAAWAGAAAGAVAPGSGACVAVVHRRSAEGRGAAAAASEAADGGVGQSPGAGGGQGSKGPGVGATQGAAPYAEVARCTEAAALSMAQVAAKQVPGLLIFVCDLIRGVSPRGMVAAPAATEG